MIGKFLSCRIAIYYDIFLDKLQEGLGNIYKRFTNFRGCFSGEVCASEELDVSGELGVGGELVAVGELGVGGELVVGKEVWIGEDV